MTYGSKWRVNVVRGVDQAQSVTSVERSAAPLSRLWLDLSPKEMKRRMPTSSEELSRMVRPMLVPTGSEGSR